MLNNVGWQRAVWNEINEAVIQEVAKVRIAQRTPFPRNEVGHGRPDRLQNVLCGMREALSAAHIDISGTGRHSAAAGAVASPGMTTAPGTTLVMGECDAAIPSRFARSWCH
jgi:hypothetical protein